MRFRLVPLSLIVAALGLALTGCSKKSNNDGAAAYQNTPASPASDNGGATSNPYSMAATSNGAAPDNGNTTATDPDNSGTGQPQGFSTRNAPGPEAHEPVTLPAGTVVNVRLQTAVSSASASPGQSFEAVLDGPLVVNGETIAPRGASVMGRVVDAKSSGRLHDSGYLRLALASIDIHGKAIPIETSSVFAKGANHNRRDAAMIGGGAGVGTLVGALAGGGKGALIGGLVGAGAGTGGAYATGKKDIEFAVERRLSFKLLQPVTTRG